MAHMYVSARKPVHENLSSSEASTCGELKPLEEVGRCETRKWRNPPTASWRGNMATDWWVGSSAHVGYVCIYIIRYFVGAYA